jgi:ribose/xylose/arabinose/galactoside ABC-type transport system permease subunit
VSLQEPQLLSSRALPPIRARPWWKRVLASQEFGLLAVIILMVVGLTLTTPWISRPERETLSNEWEVTLDGRHIIARTRVNEVLPGQGQIIARVGPGYLLSGLTPGSETRRFYESDGWTLDHLRHPTKLVRGAGGAEMVPIVNANQTLKRMPTGFELRGPDDPPGSGAFYPDADGWRLEQQDGRAVLRREALERRWNREAGWRYQRTTIPNRQSLERVARSIALSDRAAVELVWAGFRVTAPGEAPREFLQRDGWRPDDPRDVRRFIRLVPGGDREEFVLPEGARVWRLDSGFRVTDAGVTRFYPDAEDWRLVQRLEDGLFTSVGTGAAPRGESEALLSPGTPLRFMEQPPRVNKFLQPDNLIVVLTQASFIAIMAVGMTCVIILGGIDLSVGSIYALSAVAGAMALSGLASWEGGRAAVGVGESLAVAMVVCCGVGAICGFLNGVATVGLGLHPFIITLGGMAIYRGIALVLTRGQSITDVPPSYQEAIKVRAFGINPVPALLMVLVGLAGAFMLSRTVYGRRLYAIGGNETAARYAGIPVKFTKVIAFTILGTLAGFSSALAFGMFGGASSNDGMGYELFVIAAAVIGGAALTGGRGSAFGAVLGAIIMQLIDNGFQSLGIDANYRQIVIGLAIIIAVVVDQAKYRLTSRQR